MSLIKFPGKNLIWTESLNETKLYEAKLYETNGAMYSRIAGEKFVE